MACYFNYFVDSVECSNDNVIPKNHTEKEMQIVFTECGILPDNVNESSLSVQNKAKINISGFQWYRTYERGYETSGLPLLSVLVCYTEPVFTKRPIWTLLLGGILSPWNDLLTRFISVQYHEYQWNTGILYNKKDLKCRINMACYFNYFVDIGQWSVQVSNVFIVPTCLTLLI
jgi:hypothetical protein